MKKFRKIMAVLVAAIMIMAMCVPTWAESGKGRLDGKKDAGDTADMPTSGTITIHNAEDGETYNFYKILDLYSFTDNDIDPNKHDVDNEHYAYMIEYDATNFADMWYQFIYDHSDNKADATQKYFHIDTTRPFTTYVTGKTYYFVTALDAFDYIKHPASGVQVEDEVDRDGSIETDGSGNTSRKLVQQFATDALTFAKAHTTYCAPQKSILAESTAATTPAGTETGKVTIEYTSAPLGYYLVDSSLGTLVALDTTNNNVEMYDKNENPTVDKWVRNRKYADVARDNSSTYVWPSASRDNVWIKNADYEIGDKVTFLTKITVPFGAKGYTYYDVLEDGFTLVDNFATAGIRVFAGTAAQMTSYSGTDYFTVITTNSNGYDFKVAFTDTFLETVATKATLSTDAIIEIEYDTYLNENAFVKGDTAESDTSSGTTAISKDARGDDAAAWPLEGDPVNPKGITEIKYNHNTDQANTNSGILLFGKKSATSTEGNATKWASATVETYQFDLVKTKEDFSTPADGVYQMLAGAEFELYESTKNAAGEETGMSSTKVALKKVDANTYTKPNNGTAAAGTTTTITTVASGEINIRGLEKGTYYLKETKAPTGFHFIDGYFKLVISDSSTTSTVDLTAPTVTFTQYNNATTPAAIAGPTDVTWNATDVDTNYTNTNAAPNGGLQVINTTSTELPSTGGMGTTVLYIVGGMLVILAGAYLFFSRKKTA